MCCKVGGSEGSGADDEVVDAGVVEVTAAEGSVGDGVQPTSASQAT
jgi:hypothetical protein